MARGEPMAEREVGRVSDHRLAGHNDTPAMRRIVQLEDERAVLKQRVRREGRLTAPLLFALLAMTAAFVTVSVALLNPDAPAPAPRWYFVERATTEGVEVDLSCAQWVNRVDLASRASVPLVLGDKLKTICTVVAKPPVIRTKA